VHGAMQSIANKTKTRIATIMFKYIFMHLQKAKNYTLKKRRVNVLRASKHLLLYLCFSLFAVLGHAQKLHKPVSIDPLKDKLQYQNFTIRLIPTINGYYGFDILQGGKLVLHQIDDPQPAKGLTVKQNAFELAKWMITQYRNSGRFPRVIPPDVEKQFLSSQPR
jgi:hypothetical protein